MKKKILPSAKNNFNSLIYSLLLLLSFVNYIYSDDNVDYIRYKNLNGVKYVYLSDLAKYYGMSLRTKNDGCEIRKGNTYFSFTFEKRAGNFSGIGINYLYPPVHISGQSLVSELDYRRIIIPLLTPAYGITPKRIKNIVIDPGHGGKDNGAQTLYKEKDINLSISLKLQNELTKRGYKVFLTRSNDRGLELEDRTAFAKKVNADIFISIHCNATSNRYIRGIETFCLTPEGAPSTSDKKPSSTFLKGNSFNNQNIFLAYLVQRFLIGNTATIDRGIKHARFVVLKTAPCPAVLVECGFLTNNWEMKNLAWTKYQQAIAESIAQAVTYYSNTIK
ncbi:MAG TPA: N-acetylmuramoyl-L-alanine amidase [Victivallales bacterium]|nr:N-acetylmuramoyl-L-alanine amidase [Victivallales bacterium]